MSVDPGRKDKDTIEGEQKLFQQRLSLWGNFKGQFAVIHCGWKSNFEKNMKIDGGLSFFVPYLNHWCISSQMETGIFSQEVLYF